MKEGADITVNRFTFRRSVPFVIHDTLWGACVAFWGFTSADHIVKLARLRASMSLYNRVGSHMKFWDSVASLNKRPCTEVIRWLRRIKTNKISYE